MRGIFATAASLRATGYKGEWRYTHRNGREFLITRIFDAFTVKEAYSTDAPINAETFLQAVTFAFVMGCGKRTKRAA